MSPGSENMQDIDKAAQAVLKGKVLIYPTETFYALGCSALDSRACGLVFQHKFRAQAKPLPVLIGGLEQLQLLSSCSSQVDLQQLADSFWPGPLSVLLPAKPGLPSQIQNEQGYVSLRWTPHPIAQRLCLEAGRPLVATSANISLQPPAARPEDLDPDLLQKVDFFLDGRPLPAGGLPSTVVQIAGQNRLWVLRLGAVGEQDLLQAGYELVL
ncbi:MAG: L-threonylcarbamoyladenylate synthase [Desulfohalobiaceae bacterium]